jgi:hypothetical protein
MKKTYFLKPTMTFNTVTILPDPHKPVLGLHPNTPGERALRQIVEDIAPLPAASPKVIFIAGTPAARTLPSCQPLPTPHLLPAFSTIWNEIAATRLAAGMFVWAFIRSSTTWRCMNPLPEQWPNACWPSRASVVGRNPWTI